MYSLTKKAIFAFYISRMVLSRKTVIWSGVAIIFSFAIINRVRLYINSEFIDATIEVTIYENSHNEQQNLYEIIFEYDNNLYKFETQFFTHQNNNEKIKVMIPNGKADNFVIFDFSHFILIAILLACIISAGWVIFLQSFFQKEKEFYFFKSREEIDE